MNQSKKKKHHVKLIVLHNYICTVTECKNKGQKGIQNMNVVIFFPSIEKTFYNVDLSLFKSFGKVVGN